jgi:HSP20 family protein
MSLIRWEPFKEADDALRRMGAMDFARWPRLFATNGDKAVEWSPVADISETEKEYVVKAELPGVKREDVKVMQDNGVLTIEGERKYEKDEKDEKTHRIERFFGSFTRSFSLPDDADAKNIRAETKDGVLNVHIPKLKLEKPKPVQIKVN